MFLFIALFKCSFCPHRFTTFTRFISLTHLLHIFLHLLLYPCAYIMPYSTFNSKLNTKLYQTKTLNLWETLNTKLYSKLKIVGYQKHFHSHLQSLLHALSSGGISLYIPQEQLRLHFSFSQVPNRNTQKNRLLVLIYLFFVVLVLTYSLFLAFIYLSIIFTYEKHVNSDASVYVCV